MLNACTELFRGAGYTAFDGELPANTRHAALATDYAHVTAPLRRLVDRFAGEVCLALSAGQDVPDWARTALPALPELMAAAESRSKKYERAVIDLVEVFLAARSGGPEFIGTVIDVESRRQAGRGDDRRSSRPGRVRGTDLPLGTEVRLRLESADWATGGSSSPSSESVRSVHRTGQGRWQHESRVRGVAMSEVMSQWDHTGSPDAGLSPPDSGE